MNTDSTNIERAKLFETLSHSDATSEDIVAAIEELRSRYLPALQGQMDSDDPLERNSAAEVHRDTADAIYEAEARLREGNSSKKAA